MSNKDDGRRYRCPECHKAYAKAEHLIRHERSHSGSKPFLCPTCSRRFSRQDSLARHIKRHAHLRASNAAMTATSNTLPTGSDGDPGAPVSFNYPFDEAGGRSYMNLTDREQQASQLGSAPSVPQDLTENDSIANDQFLQLTWPDSEDLLQSILSAELGSWLPLETLPSHSILTSGHQSAEQGTSPWLTPSGVEGDGDGGSHAVRNLSQMISNLSADVTAEAESVGLTTVFLDECLHMFFSHFIPSFPVLHRPTFIFRDWTHPLLLNAIALGSLYVGQKGNIVKGETLWRLAHTAVATSWHTLINHRGPYDTHSGIQLVLTALLGQVYANFSRNITLRKTAQVFHSLGFYWARECGLDENDDVTVPDSLDLSNPQDQTIRQWRVWAAKEIQKRALLAHYILDGQIAQYTGGPTCERHASNPLRLPCDEAVFEAATVEEWVQKMKAVPPQSTTFRDIFSSLFSTTIHAEYLSSSLSHLTISVTLEGFKSLISGDNHSSGPVVGLPSNQDISRALGRLYRCIMTSQQMSRVDKFLALLRWHAISLDTATNSGMLCRQMCHQFNIDQKVFGGKKQSSHNFDFKLWVNTPGARRALLHALAIWEILQDLPFGRAHAIHIPASVFSTAAIYCSFLLADVSKIIVPNVTDWERIMSINLQPLTTEISMFDEAPDHEVRNYLWQKQAPPPASSKLRNLKYDLHFIPIYLKSLSQPWGVAASMEEVLEQLVTLCGS